MRIGTWLFILFLAVPVTEILLFIFVGQRIGVWPTVGLVVVTAVIGLMLVSKQGRGTWNNFQREVASGQSPTKSIVHGGMILVAGALLLTPGFLTDIVGFTLLIPRAREGLRGWFVKRMVSRWVVIS